MSIEETEAASAAVVKNPANRVSLADIEANILWERTFSGAPFLCTNSIDPAICPTIAYGAINTLTICVIVLRNGFTIIGKSAPADPDNFNRDLSCKFAREDAIRQIWPLMGYAKREELARINGDEGDELLALREEVEGLREKCGRLELAQQTREWEADEKP